MAVPESARTLAEDVLAQGAEDWVHAPQLLDIAGRAGGANAEVRRDVAIGLLVSLVADGLIEIGWVTDGRHRPWGCSQGEAVLRVARDWWSRESPYVRAGDLFWLAVTPAGDSIGRAVWAREDPAAEDDLADAAEPRPAPLLGAPGLGDEVLARGSARPLSPSELLEVASHAGVDGVGSQKLLALGVLAGLVAGGRVQIGDVVDGQFVVWSGSPGAALLRAARTWSERGGEDRVAVPAFWVHLGNAGSTPDVRAETGDF